MSGKLSSIDIYLRVGNLDINDSPAKLVGFRRRKENEWLIVRIVYKKFFLDSSLKMNITEALETKVLSYEALE